MAYTTNIEQVEETLDRLGVDVEQAKGILQSNGPGFTVNYNELEIEEAIAATQQVRTALYSWLYVLGIKDRYAVKVRHFAVQVCRKLTPTVGKNTFIPGTAVGGTRGKAGTVILGEMETEDWDVLPDEESQLAEERLQAIIRGDEDALPSGDIPQSVMPEGYDPKDIFPVPKEFVTPAGLKGIDDVELD